MIAPKPLFIPLVSRWYFAFEHGLKTHELRTYGPRWNEKTCAIGRPVTLSRGYGKANRTSCYVESFEVIDLADLPEPHRSQYIEVYGDRPARVAVIGLGGLKK